MAQLLLEDRIAKMFNLLSIPSEFGCDEEDFEDNNLNYKVYDAIYKNGGEVASGCSKMVIVMNNCDKVIKIPYAGYFHYSETYNDETQCWEVDEDPSFYEFECAHGENTSWNYCEVETEIYDKAVDFGVEQFFAKTEYYGSVDMHPVYIQERVEEYFNADKNSRDFSDKANEIYKSNRKLQCKIDPDWVKCAIDWYGEQAVEDLFEFLINVVDIGDFHTGNIGFRLNGAPVLLDYSDYNE